MKRRNWSKKEISTEVRRSVVVGIVGSRNVGVRHILRAAQRGFHEEEDAKRGQTHHHTRIVKGWNVDISLRS